MQEPAPVRWTVDPATLQVPLAVKLTAKLDEAVALTAKSGAPKVFAASAPNVIVWLPLAIENDWGTSAAGVWVAVTRCARVTCPGSPPGMGNRGPTTRQHRVSP